MNYITKCLFAVTSFTLISFPAFTDESTEQASASGMLDEIIVTAIYLNASASIKGESSLDCGDLFRTNLIMVRTVQISMPRER